MDWEGPDQRDGQCRCEFRICGDDRRGVSRIVELEGVDGGGIDWDEFGRVGAGSVVLPGWRGECGGAAGGEHGAGSVGWAGRTVEADHAFERWGAGELGREPRRPLDEWRHAGAGMA